MARRLGDAFLRLLSGFGATLGAVPDPHGQFPGTPMLWHVQHIQEQPDGPPPGHPG
jgi:hypothetical protein